MIPCTTAAGLKEEQAGTAPPLKPRREGGYDNVKVMLYASLTRSYFKYNIRLYSAGSLFPGDRPAPGETIPPEAGQTDNRHVGDLQQEPQRKVTPQVPQGNLCAADQK